MKTNRLIHEKSPYLLQHAANPVNWYPWGNEAFDQAKSDNKLVFLSIGYATCHWCHVMEKESFEDQEVADYLNEIFICIKVDREERPDIDAVYMHACQLLTGSGGWPLTIFMTPEKKPFFAATYIPKQSRFGRLGIIDLCRQVKELWTYQPSKIQTSAATITDHMHKLFEFSAGDNLDQTLLDKAYRQIERQFDTVYAGFEPAPKFPTPHRLLFLLRHYHHRHNANALDMVTKTLKAMRLGGLWDHVGFGFHRYSTDKQWLLPHFEKMLYDQALLSMVYLEAYQITKDRFFADTAEDIFTYVLRDMTSDDGAFYAAEDADSEGEEGKFYVWRQDEFQSVIGEKEANWWESVFNLSVEGNFTDEATGKRTGSNILFMQQSLAELASSQNATEFEMADRFEKIRNKLWQHRQNRIHPLKDDKILTDWNGLMIAALAFGSRVLQNPQYLEAAQKATRFIKKNMMAAPETLFHRYRDGEVAIVATANDYAFLIFGLLELYAASFKPADLEHALNLQKQMLDDFWDVDKGGFFLTQKMQKELPTRPKELYDGALPSANSIAFLNLLKLARLTGDSRWEDYAQDLSRAFAGSVQKQPIAFTQFLIGLDFALNPGQEIVIAGEPHAADTQSLLSVLGTHYIPNQVTLFKTDDNAGRLAQIAGYTDGLQVIEGKATAHVCRDFKCQEPTTDINRMLNQIIKHQS